MEIITCNRDHEEFRANAAECEELARWWGGPIKHQYEHLARQWLFLAEQVEASKRRGYLD
jgi:hypothetical protein